MLDKFDRSDTVYSYQNAEFITVKLESCDHIPLQIANSGSHASPKSASQWRFSPQDCPESRVQVAPEHVLQCLLAFENIFLVGQTELSGTPDESQAHCMSWEV